jgi:PKD repeat protein
MKRSTITRALVGLALLAVALGAAAFQAKSADAQVPFVTAGGPYAGTAGYPVQFSAASNIGPVSSVYWSFGDGSSDRGFTVLKTYVAPGVYPVSVTVTNIYGQSFTASTTATIGGAAVVTAPACRYVVSATTPTWVDLTGNGSTALLGGTSTLVCSPTSTTVVVPGTVVLSPYCYTVWTQYGFFPAWVVGCR